MSPFLIVFGVTAIGLNTAVAVKAVHSKSYGRVAWHVAMVVLVALALAGKF